MRVSPRVVIALLALVLVGVVLLSRFNLGRSPQSSGNETSPRAVDPAAPSTDTPQRTSEELIAAALKAGDITYDESLLARAYAIFDDPRLEPAFRSPIMNWEAAPLLLSEIERREATLSKDLLAALTPFRVRPNHPLSIVNQPRAEAVPAQFLSDEGWVGELVAGTRIRVWIKGAKTDLVRYKPMIKLVWDAFPGLFSYPRPDDGDTHTEIDPSTGVGDLDGMINPDGAIDVYMIRGDQLDPRSTFCEPGFTAWYCFLGNAEGVAPSARPKNGRQTSGYVMVNVNRPDDVVLGAIAHELAHVTQYGYDFEEEHWLKDSTADWVAYKVLKKLGKEPRGHYDKAERFFKGLQRSLNRTRNPLMNPYDSWLFFFYASTELGDAIVEEVWRKAASVGVDDVRAVDGAIPLKRHLPGFTVRNWNQESAPQYRTWDSTFRPGLVPLGIVVPGDGLGTTELDEPVPHLAAQYYEYDYEQRNEVRRVTFENLFTDLPNAHIWAIPQIDAVWKAPEDWTGATRKVFCRDITGQNLTGLVLIVSNSHLANDDAVPAAHPKPRVIAQDVGCPYIEGSAKATLQLKDDRRDMRYVSDTVKLRFRPRSVQDPEVGNVEYDVMPTAVRWTLDGREDGCPVSGESFVSIPAVYDQPLDISRPVGGHMVVVAPNGGDFHTVYVAAVGATATYEKRCPGSPPVVTRHPFHAGWLLHIVSQANTHEATGVVYKGKQTLDPDRVLDNLPAEAREALEALPGGRPVIRNQRAGRVVYTFEYELKPMAPAPPP